MMNLKLDVVRFANEDVIATSFFAVSAGGNDWNIYSGRMTGAHDANGFAVDMGSTPIDTYSGDDILYDRGSNLGYPEYNQNLYVAYDVGGGYYTQGATAADLGYQEHMTAGGQGASGFPTNPPSVPIPIP